jgi:hypothetical protein
MRGEELVCPRVELLPVDGESLLPHADNREAGAHPLVKERPAHAKIRRCLTDSHQPRQHGVFHTLRVVASGWKRRPHLGNWTCFFTRKPLRAWRFA